jgi:dolichol-phosphate mannosyltransferase
MIKVKISIPGFGDCLNLSQFLGNKENILDDCCFYVNDNSTDNSLELLLKARKQNSRIKILNLSRRFGVYPGIMAGVKSSTGDALIYMDIDLQDPPDLIPEMVKFWIKENYDVVLTTRTKSEGENFLKKGLSYISYLILKNTTSIDIFTNSGDFRLISRKIIDKYIHFQEIEPFFRFLIDWIGFKRKQIFYTRRIRRFGKSKFPFGIKKINQYFDVFLTPFSDFPLKFIFFWIIK